MACFGVEVEVRRRLRVWREEVDLGEARRLISRGVSAVARHVGLHRVAQECSLNADAG